MNVSETLYACVTACVFACLSIVTVWLHHSLWDYETVRNVQRGEQKSETKDREKG